MQSVRSALAIAAFMIALADPGSASAEFTLRGEFTDAQLGALTTYLRDAPAPEIRIAEATGGRLSLALEMAERIRRADASVVLDGDCLSACVFLLAAAPDLDIQRALDHWVIVGIHKPRLLAEGGLAATRHNALRRELTAWLRHVDGPEGLVDLIYSTPGGMMRALTTDELHDLFERPALAERPERIPHDPSSLILRESHLQSVEQGHQTPPGNPDYRRHPR